MSESAFDQQTRKGRDSLPTVGGYLDVGFLMVPPRLTLVSFEAGGSFPSFCGCCVEGFGVVGREDEVTLIRGSTVGAPLGRSGRPSSGVTVASAVPSVGLGLLSRPRSFRLCLRYNEVRRRLCQKKFQTLPQAPCDPRPPLPRASGGERPFLLLPVGAAPVPAKVSPYHRGLLHVHLRLV